MLLSFLLHTCIIHSILSVLTIRFVNSPNNFSLAIPRIQVHNNNNYVVNSQIIEQTFYGLKISCVRQLMWAMHTIILNSHVMYIHCTCRYYSNTHLSHCMFRTSDLILTFDLCTDMSTVNLVFFHSLLSICFWLTEMVVIYSLPEIQWSQVLFKPTAR